MVLVDGVRTPFLMSSGAYKNLMPHDLQRMAMVRITLLTSIPVFKMAVIILTYYLATLCDAVQRSVHMLL